MLQDLLEPLVDSVLCNIAVCHSGHLIFTWGPSCRGAFGGASGRWVYFDEPRALLNETVQESLYHPGSCTLSITAQRFLEYTLPVQPYDSFLACLIESETLGLSGPDEHLTQGATVMDKSVFTD